MKKFFALLSSFCLMLSGCAKTVAEPAAKDILALFGHDKADVLDTLSLLSDLTEETEHEEVRVILPSAGEKGKDAVLIFYNDILMGIQYTFSDTDTAFSFVKELRPQIDEVFGEKTTYPGVVSSSSAYFDEITEAAQLQPIVSYYEDWTPEIDEAQISKMLDGKETERVDARLTFTVYPENGTEVKIRYLAIIKRG